MIKLVDRVGMLSVCMFAVSLLAIAGCGGGPALVPVSGTVYMDGKPLKYAGFVRIEPVNGRAATGKINPADGTFVMTSRTDDDGCLPGEHPVAVIVSVNVGETNHSLIDRKYSSVETSGLTVNLSRSSGEIKIELFGGVTRPPRRRKALEEYSPEFSGEPVTLQ